MNRFEKSLPYIVGVPLLAALVVVLVLTASRAIEAAPVNLSVQDALGSMVPITRTSGCKNVNMAALTPGVVASGTALHASGVDSKAFAVSVADDDAVAGSCSDCWFVTTSTETAATPTGLHIPKGGIMPLRLPGNTAYLAGSCVGGCIVNVCPLN